MGLLCILVKLVGSCRYTKLAKKLQVTGDPLLKPKNLLNPKCTSSPILCIFLRPKALLCCSSPLVVPIFDVGSSTFHCTNCFAQADAGSSVSGCYFSGCWGMVEEDHPSRGCGSWFNFALLVLCLVSCQKLVVLYLKLSIS